MKTSTTMKTPAPAPKMDSSDLMLIVLIIAFFTLMIIALIVELLAPAPFLYFGKYSFEDIFLILTGTLLVILLVYLINKLIHAPRPWYIRLRLLRDMRMYLLTILRVSEIAINILVNEKADEAIHAATANLCIKVVFVFARMLVIYGVSKYEGNAITTFNGLNQDTIMDPIEGFAMFALNRIRDETVSEDIVVISQGICFVLTFVINEMSKPLDD